MLFKQRELLQIFTEERRAYHLKEEDDDVVERVATTTPTVEAPSRPKRRVNWMDSASTEQVAGTNESTSGSSVSVPRPKRAKPVAPPLQQLVERFKNSRDKLLFIKYRHGHTQVVKWFLVQAILQDTTDNAHLASMGKVQLQWMIHHAGDAIKQQWMIRHAGDAMKQPTELCRYWPEIRRIDPMLLRRCYYVDDDVHEGCIWMAMWMLDVAPCPNYARSISMVPITTS